MNLKVGDKVIDSEGMTGVIQEINNAHNIYVRYPRGKGHGLYCQVKGCKMYDPLKKVKVKKVKKA